MEKTYSRYAHLDFLRILSAVMVIGIHCLAPVTESTAFVQAAATNSLHNILNFSVPMFIIITGGLLMSNEQKYTFSDMFKKYIIRALLCIVVFGTLFALMELVITEKTINLSVLLTAVLYMLTGRSFDHMWYLYMLVGLYIMTPVLKAFLKASSQRTTEIFLVLLFLMNYLFPCINAAFDIDIAFELPLVKWPVFYYIMGYYMMEYAPDLKSTPAAIFKIIAACICICALSTLGTVYDRFSDIAGQGSPFVIVIVYNVYLLARKYAAKPLKIYALLSPLALWIYIIHPVFIHALRIVGLSTANYPFIYPILIAVIFVVSTFSAYIMNKCLTIAAKFLRR